MEIKHKPPSILGFLKFNIGLGQGVLSKKAANFFGLLWG